MYTKEWCSFNKKFISLLTRAQRTPSAVATVQVSRVRVLLNRVLQQCWIRCAAKGDNHLLPWPPCSPDLKPCNFFLWGFVKDSVYVPPLPMSLNELRDRITHALQTITADMLHRVWYEFQGHGQWWYVNAVFNEPPKTEIALC